MSSPTPVPPGGSPGARGEGPPPLLGTGFRLFFLLGALAALGLVPAWLHAFHTGLEEMGLFPPLEWHRHEMLFGFAAAIVAGFLLTAVPNWCGTPHRRGAPVLLLALLWTAGRVALLIPDWLPRGLPTLLDVSFLPALGLLLAPELVRARKLPNLSFLLVLAALTACNLTLHLGALEIWEDHSYRVTQVTLDLMILLVLVIGGRVIPYFTRKKLGVTIEERPATWVAAHLALLAMVVTEAMGAPGIVRAIPCSLAALFAIVRLSNWQFRAVWRTPLLWVLHLGYAWVVLGLLVKALSAVDPAFHPRLSAHFLTVGGIGTMTLGMMTRVSLGHTGRPLVAGRTMTFAFLMMNLAAILRAVVPVFWAGWYLEALLASGGLWMLAFLLYLVVFVPVLVSPRPDGKES